MWILAKSVECHCLKIPVVILHLTNSHKPKTPLSATIVAVLVTENGEKSRKTLTIYGRLWSPKMVAVFGDIVAVPCFHFRQLYSVKYTTINVTCPHFFNFLHSARYVANLYKKAQLTQREARDSLGI